MLKGKFMFNVMRMLVLVGMLALALSACGVEEPSYVWKEGIEMCREGAACPHPGELSCSLPGKPSITSEHILICQGGTWQMLSDCKHDFADVCHYASAREVYCAKPFNP